MSRPSKGARLYRRGNKGYFYIRDGDTFVTTGTKDRGQADRALARHIAEKDRPAGPRAAHDLTIDDALDFYGEEHGMDVRAPKTLGYSIKALRPLLGPLPVGTLTKEQCRRYARERGVKPGTVRRELGVLQAAVNHCHAQGYLLTPIKVTLPPMPAPRDRWLTRDESARLLRAAYRNPKARHLARFILVALYTGTRSNPILRMQYMPNTSGGWVDTKRGVMYRRAAGESESKKRTPPVPIPRPLLAHLHRWKRQGARYVVEVGGQRVGCLKTAWRTALEEAGIDYCRPHDLRHTAVTWAMQRGADKWAAAGYFGMTLDTLESVYGHHHPDHLRSAVEAMEKKA